MQSKSRKQRQLVIALLSSQLDFPSQLVEELADKIELIYRPEKSLSLQSQMISALAEVTGKFANLNAKRLAVLASELLKTPNEKDPTGFVTPEFIVRHYGVGGEFYEFDWRGIQGQWPSEASIRDTLRQAVMGWPGGRPKSGKPEHRSPEGV